MARLIYTVGGHIATLYNNTTALSGVEITDPNIILRYYTHNDTQSGARYDGITYEGRLVDTTNACYYSTQFFAKPKLSDLTAAKFVSASDLNATGTFPEGGQYSTNGTYYFPYDTDPIGCYVIPKSAYSGDKELYVYIWLPSIESNPIDNAATYIDATMLAMESIGMDIIKCDVKNTNASYMFNQTYISSMSGVNIVSTDANFGSGSEYPNTTSYPNVELYDSYPIVRTSSYNRYSYMLYSKLQNCSGTFSGDLCVDGIPINNSNVTLACKIGDEPSFNAAHITNSTAFVSGSIFGSAQVDDSYITLDSQSAYLSANNCSISGQQRLRSGSLSANSCCVDMQNCNVGDFDFDVTATSSTLSGSYSLMIGSGSWYTAQRNLVDCTGYDPDTKKIWYFENYPTIPPEDITPEPPKTLEIDTVITWGNTLFNVDVSAENYTTSYTADVNNTVFTDNQDIHLPVYVKISCNDGYIQSVGFERFNVSGADLSETYRTAVQTESGTIMQEGGWMTTALSAIYA